jgi:hypothetical protein
MRARPTRVFVFINSTTARHSILFVSLRTARVFSPAAEKMMNRLESAQFRRERKSDTREKKSRRGAREGSIERALSSKAAQFGSTRIFSRSSFRLLRDAAHIHHFSGAAAAESQFFAVSSVLVRWVAHAALSALAAVELAKLFSSDAGGEQKCGERTRLYANTRKTLEPDACAASYIKVGPTGLHYSLFCLMSRRTHRIYILACTEFCLHPPTIDHVFCANNFLCILYNMT